MLHKVLHRGPDARSNYIIDPWLALGHTRLAIQDLTSTGAQPMLSPCGRYVIVFNGEIYNVKTLRDDLEAKGICFRGTSDTEVLLYLFCAKGLTCVEYIEGMFAFAIADLEARRLFLCRDRSGEKPLFYHQHKSVFYFASEIKAFTEIVDVDLKVNPDAVIRFFCTRRCRRLILYSRLFKG
jgi:asparagine synthase (glutamine-hydrolysing)